MAHPRFQYKKRTKEQASEQNEKRANQQGGTFVGCIIDAVHTFSAAKGENWVRFCPDADPNAPHYGMDVHVHYSFGPQNATVICPLKMVNKPCPGCEAKQRFEDAGQEEAAKELRTSKRVLAYIVNRKEPDVDYPFAWLQPWTFDRDVAKAAKDRITQEYYDLVDPEEGYDITFEKDEGGGKEYAKYIAIQVNRRPSPIHPKFGEKILDFIIDHPLKDILIYRGYDELLELYGGGAAPDKKEDVRPPSDAPNAAANATARFAAPSFERRDPVEERPLSTGSSNGADSARPSTSSESSSPAQGVEPTSRPSDNARPTIGRPQIVATSPTAVESATSPSSSATASPSQSASERAAALKERWAKR